MGKKTMGQELLEAVREALAEPGAGRVLRHAVDVSALRKKLQLSQREFAGNFHINLQTLRQWEQGKRSPDTTSSAYLTCIAKNPTLISEMLRG